MNATQAIWTELQVNFESIYYLNVFQTFCNNSSEYENRSIRKAFQYKSTIKPVIICVLYSSKHFNFTKQFADQTWILRRPPSRRLIKPQVALEVTFFRDTASLLRRNFP